MPLYFSRNSSHGGDAVKKEMGDSLTIGFALFAMFFGAGNLIFPPYLGMESGTRWLLGFICYIIVDIGLSMLALLVIAKLGKGASGITDRLGKKMSFFILAVNSLCIGPLIAIPRTASITYEIGLAPLFPQLNSWVASAVFFIIVVLLSIRQSKAVDIVGKIMAPLMFIGLMVMIIKGILNPIGGIKEGLSTTQVVKEGLLSGYQTLDMIGAIIFAVAVLLSAQQKGYTEKKAQFSVIAKSGAISAVLLASVYGGLSYMGAMMSTAQLGHLSQTQLLLIITDKLMGKAGLVLLGVIVAFACLTTAIGLLSSISSFFAEHSRIKYSYYVIGFALFSWVLSNFGTSAIISLAAPVLDLIYPILIVMIVLSIFDSRIKNDGVFRGAAVGAFAASVAMLLDRIADSTRITKILPFADVGLGWVVPTIICSAIGALIWWARRRQTPAKV